MKTTLAAALLIVAGLAAAEDSKPAAPAAPEVKAAVHTINAEIKDDKSAIAADRQAIRKNWNEQKAQVQDLRTQEKAAIDAVKADAAKSEADKKTAIAAIRADFKTKKEAVRAEMKSDREAKRADIKGKRENIRQERHKRRDIREHREGEHKGK